MKKLLAVLICFTLMISSMSIINISVSAETEQVEAEPVKITVSSGFGCQGDSAKIFVDIEENSMMSSGVFTLHFDSTKLEAKNVEIGSVLQGGYSSVNIASPGRVKVSYVNTSPIYEGGRLFEVDVNVIGDTSIGDITDLAYYSVGLELDVFDLAGYDYTKITPDIISGDFIIVNTKYGDANLDGEVTPSDTLLILNHAVNLVEFNDDQLLHADVTGEGIVNAVDAMYILRHTAGVISSYPVCKVETPTGLSVTEKDETSIVLKWDPVDFVCGYNLYCNGKQVNDSLIKDTTYTISSLEQDTQYSFFVTAHNTLRRSQSSDPLFVSTNKADRTVIFKDYDGTVIETQIVLSGTDATAPAAPSRVGYTFTGWDHSLENITEDTIITAQYSINSYTVKYNSNGGSAVSSATLEYGSLLEKPKNPTRTDYTFMGWYTDSAFVNEWDFESDVITKNITLYAKWETWSAWSTSVPSTVTSENYIIESRKEYRYRTKSTTTSSSDTLSGWTRYDTKLTSWTDWSSWQNTAVSANGDRQVETRYIAPTYKTVWHYNRSTNGTYSTYALGYYGANSNQYITLDYRLSLKGYIDGRAHYGTYGSYLKNLWWNESSSQQLVTAGYTQYRYKTAVYTYYFYKWSAWSDWSTNSAAASDTKDVQTRTVYRYIPIEK